MVGDFARKSEYTVMYVLRASQSRTTRRGARWREGLERDWGPYQGVTWFARSRSLTRTRWGAERGVTSEAQSGNGRKILDILTASPRWWRDSI